MRFLVMVKATKDSEAGVMPSEQLLREMGAYNEQLVKAGVLLAGEGLHPSSKGVRVRFAGTDRTVIDGPFTETKELVRASGCCRCARGKKLSSGSDAAPIPATASPRLRSARCSRPRTSVIDPGVRSDCGARLSAVLEVIYLVFNEGYSATAGDDWIRPALCEDALRLGRVLAELAPDDPEVHGLVALMEIQSSRLRARVGPAGEPVRLLDQNRVLWDRLLIRRGLAALQRAEAIGGAAGPYVLQAAIAACHARAGTPQETDWSRITVLYATLAQITRSPIVSLNHAVAVGMAHGPQAGLELVDALISDPALTTYHYLPSARGDFLEKLGRLGEARAEFERAAGLTKNARERALLLDRAHMCAVEIEKRVIALGGSAARSGAG